MITFQVKGRDCYIDDCDKDLLEGKKWQLHIPKAKKGNSLYLEHQRTINKKNKKYYMHRVIMGRVLGRELERREEVDHIDHNGLNNQRKNLRLATRSQNGANKLVPANNSSGYKGVSWDKSRGKWFSKITVNKKQIPLGRYATIELAYAAYVEAAKKYFGEFWCE